jgi:hypothetical protein
MKPTKVSELITSLKEILDTHGDIDVEIGFSIRDMKDKSGDLFSSEEVFLDVLYRDEDKPPVLGVQNFPY